MQSHFLYGAILGVSLLGAFLTWTEEPDPISGDEIELLSGKLEDLQEIEWNSPKNFVRISKKDDSLNKSLWVFYKEEEKDSKKNFKASKA